MNVDHFQQFVQRATAEGVRLQIPEFSLTTARPDALFHIPLLALTVLGIATARREGISSVEVGTWVALTIQRAFDGLRLSPQRLRYSVTLRRRCADALAFLEAAQLIKLTGGDRRMIRPTEEGATLYRKSLLDEGDIGILARGISRGFSAARRQGMLL